jgi:hypothetical protein
MPTDKHLDAFLEEFGQPTQRVVAPPEVIERFRGKLPDKLLGYWQELGFSGFADGLFWLTSPDDYEGALEDWVGDTAIMEEDAYHVIGRSGFGDLFLWGDKNGYKYVVNASMGWILQKDGSRERIATKGADSALQAFFAVMSRRRCDMDGADKKPLFERAVAKWGPLAPDELFAFEPSLIAGGTPKLESLAKRNAQVHLSILAQLGEREILDREALTRKAFG